METLTVSIFEMFESGFELTTICTKGESLNHYAMELNVKVLLRILIVVSCVLGIHWFLPLV